METQLQALGLSPTEVKVYLALLHRGRATPALLAKDTQIKRPTVYAALNQLLDRGIIWEDHSGRTKMLTAQPGDLKNIIRRKKKALAKEESQLEGLMPELTEIARSVDLAIPRIQYVREVDMLDFLNKQSPIWNDSMMKTPDKSWWGYNSNDLTQHKEYRDWIDWNWSIAPKEISLHLFSQQHAGEKSLSKNKYPRRHITYWDEDMPSSLWITGDYIILVVTKKRPHYLIQIRDILMAQSLRTTYQALWKKYNE